ncbi:MAG TPA: 4Fe-4S dicluster domain-containing protein [Candidatus Methanofastidiosa archaeon]|nr:4Fe-4S dicluster domain-containing protein [Candidatus Methanofastidiosa archaeon]HPR42645.1 4Fe-4S dicluster domain-containing protein [Candidatus Methanofastidiosa archaeon]
MREMLIFMVKGAYNNISRILFATERKTSIPMRNKILNGEVEYPQVVNDDSCIGCGACANICPVDAITMVELEKPIEITDDYIKEKKPVYDAMKCMYCFQCHDSCPIFAFYGKPGAIHPRHVGEAKINLKELLQRPIVIRDKKEFEEVMNLLDDKAKKLLEGGK